MLAAHGWQSDAAQLAAVAAFAALEARLAAAELSRGGLLARGLRAISAGPDAPAVKGLYLWGGVGRGKTFLVDLFCAHVSAPVTRRHFHHFMRDVHAKLRAQAGARDPLARIAESMAAECRVLCFDELYVTDIADAMILGTFFEALLRAGVTLVFTSNVAPGDLYADGLQRARFLPAIALIERHCEVLALDAGVDYRLRELRREPLWLTGEAASSGAALRARLATLAGEAVSGEGQIEIEGRTIATRLHSARAAWFDFPALCAGPRSTADYIAIAERFGVVAVSSIPVFTAADDDAARRFIALVDELYDRGVKLLASAAAAPEQLYAGSRLEFEYRRTVSRLIEMQSSEYLARAHRVDPG